jgi:lipopolysaccharide export system protein LptA
VYHLGSGDILVRLDTFFYHTSGDPAQQARDLYLKQHAGGQNIEVRSIYDTQILGDATGNAAVRALADVLAGREIIAPARSGLANAPMDEVLAP